jgi:transcriptional regulator with XRE-family HTH domain
MDQARRKRFVAIVRQLRLANGQTQEELAHRARLHPTYIGGVERGERNISLDNILKVARGLGVPPATLFRDTRR